ncbi:SHOCT domain-containing protein [Halorussus amylolyticus]|uniref:SHOCT domain-containing protein n=1 Tax=Halorussus amylolyticus TaxID=1126242 RepID=UPI00138F814E|nr:SHOCT domain-containing protein [Halorussus amylolyticus]
MSPSRDAPAPLQILARCTPDSHRWRRLLAGAAMTASALTMYAAFAVASGVKSGTVYDLLILVFGILTVLLPAVASAALLAPDSWTARPNASRNENALETLKRRYAAGEINREEFDRRLDDLIVVSDSARERANDGSLSTRTARETDFDPATR